jgi:prevent-host-death family protein
MRYSVGIKPISHLKANAAKIVQEVQTTRRPLIITQRGKAKALIQDIATYEETQGTLALLRILALGTQQAELGKTRPIAEVSKRIRARSGNE